MAVDRAKECRWCGWIHGPACPMVKAIEYFEDGITVKCVEFKDFNDRVEPQPYPPRPPLTFTTYTVNTEQYRFPWVETSLS